MIRPYKSILVLVTMLALWGAIAFGGCTLSRAASNEPTMSVTQAYQTVQARLTEVIALTPSPGASPTTTENRPVASSPTTALTAGSPTVALNTPASSPEASCTDLAAPGNPFDLTIEDDTPMQPGQKFTKIWRLGNVGTCTWTRQYRAAWFFGPKLGDTLSISMPGNVPPGQTIDLVVDMTAPLTPDTYQSNWKLVNASGESFGIGPNGDLPFWVRIVVVQEATATITPTFSPSLTPTGTTPPSVTPTLTSTPAIAVTGPAILLPGDRLDLDTNQVNSGSGEDILYQTAADNTHWLRPQGEALLGIYGTGEPSLEVCRSASMSGAPVAVESLSEGSYLCFQTGQGLPGWLRYDGFNPADASINVTILTWMQP